MAGIGGVGAIGAINPIVVSIITQPAQAIALQPGQVLLGIVQSVEPHTVLRFGGMMVPVERIVGIAAGQAVSAEVISTPSGLQLRVTPQAAPSAPQPAAETSGLPDVLTVVLRSLGRLDAAADSVHLIPKYLPTNASSIRLALSLFLDRDGVGRDLELVTRLVRQAVQGDAIPRKDAEALLSLLRVSHGIDEDNPAQAARGAARSALRPLAARLAELVARGDLLSLHSVSADDLPAQLVRLRSNDAFIAFLRDAGQLGEFERAVDHVIERLAAAQIANLRSLDVPYYFFEIPYPPATGLRNAQVHIFGEGGGKGRDLDGENVTIAIDLSTGALGDLWITLSMVRNACACVIRTSNPGAVRIIENAAVNLATRLEALGYRGVTVHASVWDGNSVREAANLMRRTEGIQLEA